ncbi:MAG: hypothetical protein V1784_08200 [bacterium]
MGYELTLPKGGSVWSLAKDLADMPGSPEEAKWKKQLLENPGKNWLQLMDDNSYVLGDNPDYVLPGTRLIFRMYKTEVPHGPPLDVVL